MHWRSRTAMRKVIRSETMNAQILLALFAGTLTSFSGFAHHSPVTLYHVDQMISIEGVVTEFRLGNPHTRVYLKVTNQSGDEESWLAEGGTRSVMVRRGWTEDMIKVGTRVRINGNPARDGSNLIHTWEIVLPDGTKLEAEDVSLQDSADRFRRRIQRNDD